MPSSSTAGRVFAVVHELVAIDRLVLLAVRRVDADLAEQAFHAEGARFVGDDRHAARADLLVAQDDVERLHERHRGADLAIAGALEQAVEGFELGHFQRLAALAAALRQVAAELLAALVHVLDFGRLLARVEERHLAIGQLRVGHRDVEAVAEDADGFVVELLGLVRGVERLAGRAHAVALHRLGEDHGRHALGVHRFVVRGIDLVRVVAAAVEAPDVVVGQVRHQLGGFGVLAEEVLARVLAAEGLAVLVFAVDGFHHQLAQLAAGVARQERIPVAAPDGLDDVPAGAAELAFQFLDDLAVAAHRAVQALQVAVNDEDQVVQAFATGHRDGAERFGFVRLAVAEERPHLAVALGQQAAAFQILPVARLVDRRERAQAHRHGRHLPVVGHQPGMRVRRDAAAVDFHAEVVELRFAHAAFEERTGVDARRAVALHADDVARVVAVRTAPEVVEAHVIERGGRGERRDVAAEFARLAVGAHDHGERVPADDRADAPFHRVVAGALGLQVRGNGVDVFGGRLERQVRTGAARDFDHAFEQLVGALGAVARDDGLDGLDPLAGFGGVRVVLDQVVDDSVERRHAYRGPYWPRLVWGRVRASILTAGPAPPDPVGGPLRCYERRMAARGCVRGRML